MIDEIGDLNLDGPAADKTDEEARSSLNKSYPSLMGVADVSLG
jgi:hypothetical protein